MSDIPELRSASVEGLLQTYAALTHRIRAGREDKASLRTQRDLVGGEIQRRCEGPLEALVEGSEAVGEGPTLAHRVREAMTRAWDEGRTSEPFDANPYR